MKKKKIYSIFLIFMLLLCVSFDVSGQDRNWYNSLFKLLKLDQHSKIGILRGPDRFGGKDEVRRLAIHNIRKHLEEVAKLRALGKTEEEIRVYFNSLRKASGTGSISGILYESDGETPVQNYVSVWAYNEYGQYSGYASISSWSNGVYVIDELFTGKYYLRTSTYSYRNEYYDDATDWRDATLVSVTDGQMTGNINFILDSLEEGEGGISGQVLAIDGIPLNDCSITAYDQDYNGVSYGSSDENGLYVVDKLPSGKYKIQVRYYGSENYIGEWYDNAQSFETATFVTVTEPYTTEGIDFILDYGGAIEGRVYCATGEPVGAYNCYITAYDPEENWVDSELADENGNFVISKLRTGVYRLRFDYYGHGNFLDGWHDGAEDFESATPISVTAPDITKVDITLQAGGAISGIVLDYNGQPLSRNCYVNAYDENQDQIEGDQIDENGNYTILQLPTGRYKLFARYTGHTRVVGEEPASEWYDGVYEFEDATFVEVTAPDTTENIDFALKRGGYVGGYVYGPEGQVLSYCGSVDAYNLQRDKVGTSIISRSQYFITGLPTGDYKITVQYEGEGNYKDEWYDEKQNFETANPVRVTAPNRAPNVNFALEYPGILQGFVTEALGNRLIEEEYFLQIYAYDANSGDYIDYDNNSFVGGYQFELLGRDYKLAAVPFYYNWMLKQDSLAAAYHEHGTSFNDPSTQTISLAADTTLKLKDLVMEEVNGAISGTVCDECNGQPVTKGLYIVFAFDEDGYLVKGSAYSEFNAPITGEYQLCGLRPGKYYLLAIAGSDPFIDLLIQWYYGIEASIDLETLTPKVTIPPNASAIIVGEGLISGIDFYFGITPQFALTITAGSGGTTNPSLGAHSYCEGTEVMIKATPNSGYTFSSWSGDVPSGHQNDNPLTITMDSDKSIKANFAKTQTDSGEKGKGGGCFIDTACYDTPMAEEVKILYAFRDQYLEKSPTGRAFVNLYYKYSPKIADFIRDKEYLKMIVRESFKPFIWVINKIVK